MNFAHSPNESYDIHVLDILNEMRIEKLEDSFILALMKNCLRYEGLRDLMEMWMEETDAGEKAKIIVDLQEELENIENSPVTVVKASCLKYENLHEIKEDIIEFKRKLREEVDRQGGVSELAKKTGIPQPSLSRFFTSSSMPRRTTLYKIAKALNLPESAVGFKWVN